MKVLVIGSGPIVIGQAAEFDYAGTQACKSLKEEGHEVLLINSNPATIMTDPGVSDRLYIEPLTPEFCERVVERERPDALLPTLGGQTGLNLATQLAERGVLAKYDVKLLGTPLEAIRKAEDRELFRGLMREIREPVPESFIVETEAELERILATEVPDEHGRLMSFPYPRIVRPAYTLGGTGGGIAKDPDELWDIGRKGLKLSMRSQVMIERSLLGWKEIEYEVMRDSAGNCITVCNMENFDPMGVHTGDSIVVAPSQTLSDIEYHMLRTASLKIIQALGIEGGCNVQLAVNPESFDYYVIEVNPRVSRSSALASKATGYPIARVAAKIAVGKTLDEIENQVTKTTKACFEPALDYVVVKIPRWPFDKFPLGDRTLFTQMKATGEVMAIDRTFESALMKAIRGLEVKQKDLWHEGFAGSKCGAGILPARSEGVPPSEPTAEELATRKGRYLPHWTKDGSIYHVRFRLADSVPSEVRARWKNERELLDRQSKIGALTDAEHIRLFELHSEKIEAFLDAGAGSCVLKNPTAARIVADALKFFDGERYELHAWCVMPNHVHAVLRPLDQWKLDALMHSWKSFTAKEINKAVNRTGQLWQDEYYDHIIRSNQEYEDTIVYVLENPLKAGLPDWPWIERRDRWDPALRGQDGLDTRGQDARATPAMSDELLQKAIRVPTDERLWAIAEGLRRGWTIDEVNKLCRVDKWFLNKLQNLIEQESLEPAKRRERVFKMVDTCAGEFESRTPYFYGTDEVEDDAPKEDAANARA